MKFRDINLEEILNDKSVEEDLLEIPLADRVFRVFSLIFLVLVCIVLIQFFAISVGRSSFYSRRAIANVSEIKTEFAPRGLITDRFGEILLDNEPAFNVFLSPKFLPSAPEERAKTIEEISVVLGIDRNDLNQKILKKDWAVNDRLLLLNNISHSQLVDFYSKPISGLEVESSFKRIPVVPNKFSHILGFVGLVGEKDLKENPELMIDDEIGRAGLEAYYDSYLRGTNGREIFFRNANGKVKENLAVEPSESGLRLETFIDRELQENFYDSLKNTLARLGLKAGAGLALNPQNGEVLALVSIPSFDSSKVADSLGDKSNPFFNRIVNGLYNPGSTIKPLVATAALGEKIIKPEKQIFSAGFIELPNPYNPEHPSRFLDWKPHGWVDLYAAIARSSNVYFYTVGGGFKDQEGLGIKRLREWWQKFNLDKETGIDLPGEKSGFLPDPDWKEKTTGEIWRLGDTYNVSIGQGDLLITPLELLNYISAVANGGKFYKPRIMKEAKNENGDFVLKEEPILISDIGPDLKDGIISEVQKAMRETVKQSYGTAYLLHDLPISASAKTGSAQIENNTKVNAFVVAYAPAENPQIALLVLVEDAREGSLNAVPVAREVLSWYADNRILKQKNE